VIAKSLGGMFGSGIVVLERLGGALGVLE